jgi:hypothetical protein
MDVLMGPVAHKVFGAIVIGIRVSSILSNLETTQNRRALVTLVQLLQPIVLSSIFFYATGQVYYHQKIFT